jgi:outer membrane immunogenic protein
MVGNGTMFMKTFLLAGAALMFAAGAATAADIPVKAPLLKAPPVAYDWNGFYIGGYYGTAIEQTKAHTDGFAAGVAGVNDMALAVGGTVGYNWQFAPRWLIGLEADAGFLGVDHTFHQWDSLTITGSKADGYGTVRARFGYVTGPSLLYVTGGAAFVHITDTFGGAGVPAAPATAFTTTKTGWTVGGGIETKLSRNWSTTTEYQFIDAGSTSFASNPFGVAGTGTTFDHSYHVIKTGLNYKLDGNWEGLPFFNTALLPSDHNWNGLYAGLNVGGGISLMRGINDLRGEEDMNGTGFAGGGQVGYNYMLTPRWFVGVEGDVGYLGVNSSTAAWDATFDIFTAQTSWYATARGRVGSSTGPALLYVTAGGAWVGLKDGFAVLPTSAGIDVTSRTASGWTVGGGAEVAIDSRWSAKLESLYIDVGHTNHNDFIPAPFFFGDYKERFMVVRAGLNYKFGD